MAAAEHNGFRRIAYGRAKRGATMGNVVGLCAARVPWVRGAAVRRRRFAGAGSELSIHAACRIWCPAFGEARSVATVPIRELLRAESYDEMFVSNSSDMNEYRLALLRAVCESPRFRALRVGEYAERSERARPAAVRRDDVRRGLRFTRRFAVCSLPWHRWHACRMEGGFQYGGALPGAVPGIRVSVCELDSGQVGRFPFVGSDSPAVMLGGHSKGGNMAVYAAMQYRAR